MANLSLCKEHKQEWKQSEYASHNCDYCKAANELQRLRAEHAELKQEVYMWKSTAGAEADRGNHLFAENAALQADALVCRFLRSEFNSDMKDNGRRLLRHIRAPRRF